MRFKLIPIENNRVLLVRLDQFPNDFPNLSYLELSIYEIRHYRVKGSALWTYRLDKPNLDDLKPLRSPTDILGTTLDENCMIQIKLFAMNFDHHHSDLLINEAELTHLYREISPGLSNVCGKCQSAPSLTHTFKGASFACSPNGRILVMRLSGKQAIAMLHSGSANATGFNLITQVPIPDTKPIRHPLPSPPPAFSADGLKFVAAANDGTVSLWDVRNKLPLVVKKPDCDVRAVESLRFFSGTFGREVLAVTEVS